MSLRKKLYPSLSFDLEEAEGLDTQSKMSNGRSSLSSATSIISNISNSTYSSIENLALETNLEDADEILEYGSHKLEASTPRSDDVDKVKVR